MKFHLLCVHVLCYTVILFFLSHHPAIHLQVNFIKATSKNTDSFNGIIWNPLLKKRMMGVPIVICDTLRRPPMRGTPLPTKQRKYTPPTRRPARPTPSGTPPTQPTAPPRGPTPNHGRKQWTGPWTQWRHSTPNHCRNLHAGPWTPRHNHATAPPKSLGTIRWWHLFHP